MLQYLKDNLSTVIIFSLLLGWLLYQRIPMYQASSKMEGREAPDFTLSALDGRTYRLSELRGKVVVVNFWATWCLPCKVEIPILKSLHSELENDGLVILGLTQESAAQVMSFVQEHEMNYPVVIDDRSEAADAYGIRGYPTVVVVDRDGKINSFTTGLNFFMKWQIRRLVTGSWI
ncbi:MAG: TlpA family protein disulfide reductase [Spirochaetae bacterium HGW-Spirochaetae-10]|jgi:peroxiredoxin|nr:MAG: TlpA family protein disulfide reductase [Spirochaetae bacterium HGW-Spirochaetae-10]